VSQSSKLCRHNPLCCFSTSVYYCFTRIFRYRLSPESFGHTLVCLHWAGKPLMQCLGGPSCLHLHGEVKFYHNTTRRHNPENLDMNLHRSRNMKSCNRSCTSVRRNHPFWPPSHKNKGGEYHQKRLKSHKRQSLYTFSVWAITRWQKYSDWSREDIPTPCPSVLAPDRINLEKNSPTVVHACRKMRLKWVLPQVGGWSTGLATLSL
jgi:hypothetical protein